MPKDRLRLHIFESALLFVVLVSISSISLLVLRRFNSVSAVLLGAATFVLLSIVFKFKVTFIDKRFDKVLLLILLVALFFRSEPYLWIMGGQDQGVYVNMSATYERTGSTFITDNVREKIGDEEVRGYYDLHNQMNMMVMKEGQYEGHHLPGVYKRDLSESAYVFQFYPLHPIWMSIFGKFLGSDNRVYSLVFFSLISIIAFYLLGFELSGGKKLPGYLAASFLAVNPLHAYFSKFPVSEVVFLAFSASAFYFLIRYYKESLKGKVAPFHLFLSAGSMACLFFTRISGFMYVPLFYLLLLIIVLFMQRGKVKRQLILYVLSVFGLYGLSVLYGLIYSYPYSRDIYWLSFRPLLGENWELKLGLLTIFAVLFLVGVILMKKRKFDYLLQRVAILLRNNLHLILYGIILLGAYKAYQLGFTDRYVGDPWIDARWQMANLGLRSIPFSNIFVTALYLSPFASLLMLFAINHFRRKKNILISGLLAFLAAFGAYALVIRFTTPYQYYYARYLLSELLPYSLLLASLYLGYLFLRNSRLRRAVLVLTGGILIYFLALTSFQLLGREAEGADTALKRIQMQMGGRGLLLIYKEDFASYYQIKTPLSYYYGLNVFGFEAIEDVSGVLRNVALDCGDVFVLSQVPVNRDFLTPVDKIAYKEGRFRASRFTPTKFSYSGVDLFLYKIDKNQF